MVHITRDERRYAQADIYLDEIRIKQSEKRWYGTLELLLPAKTKKWRKIHHPFFSYYL